MVSESTFPREQMGNHIILNRALNPSIKNKEEYNIWIYFHSCSFTTYHKLESFVKRPQFKWLPTNNNNTNLIFVRYTYQFYLLFENFFTPNHKRVRLFGEGTGPLCLFLKYATATVFVMIYFSLTSRYLSVFRRLNSFVLQVYPFVRTVALSSFRFSRNRANL